MLRPARLRAGVKEGLDFGGDLGLRGLPEEYDAEYFEGVATGINGSFLTIVSEDGTKKVFDISNAERQENDGFMQGCYVEVSYAEVEQE